MTRLWPAAMSPRLYGIYITSPARVTSEQVMRSITSSETNVDVVAVQCIFFSGSITKKTSYIKRSRAEVCVDSDQHCMSCGVN